jgi:hypothetical protein
LLGEFAGQSERAIDFIGGNLNETLDAMAPGAIEQDTGADDVGMDEIERRIDTAIDMRFRSEIDHAIKLVLGHERVHLVGIRDVGFEKFVTLAMFLDHAIQVGRVAGVGEDIDIAHKRRFVMLQNIPNKIAPDESAATGYQDAHRCAY